MSTSRHFPGIVADTRNGAIVRVRVRPRSSRSGVVGASDGELLVAVRAVPEGGRATAEALRVVASFLGLPPSRLTLAAGASSRSKRFRVEGETAAGLQKRLAGPLDGFEAGIG